MEINNAHFKEPVEWKPGEISDQAVMLDKDLLMDLFEKQKEFMNRLGVNYMLPGLAIEGIKQPFDGKSTKQLSENSAVLAQALACETTEFLDELNWKPWKKSLKKVDHMKVWLELVDMQHFMFELMIIWGMTPDRLYELYVLKLEENNKRQDRGY